MRERGWQVVTVDIEERFRPSIVADVCHLPIRGHFDFIWASPPCIEYSREDQPWCRTGREPDHTIYQAVRAIIDQLVPTYWVIENVRGAIKYWGKWDYHFGPVYLWTNIPILSPVEVEPWKSRLSSKQRAERARIPYSISLTVAEAVEFFCAGQS